MLPQSVLWKIIKILNNKSVAHPKHASRYPWKARFKQNAPRGSRARSCQITDDPPGLFRTRESHKLLQVIGHEDPVHSVACTNIFNARYMPES